MQNKNQLVKLVFHSQRETLFFFPINYEEKSFFAPTGVFVNKTWDSVVRVSVARSAAERTSEGSLTEESLSFVKDGSRSKKRLFREPQREKIL